MYVWLHGTCQGMHPCPFSINTRQLECLSNAHACLSCFPHIRRLLPCSGKTPSAVSWGSPGGQLHASTARAAANCTSHPSSSPTVALRTGPFHHLHAHRAPSPCQRPTTVRASVFFVFRRPACMNAPKPTLIPTLHTLTHASLSIATCRHAAVCEVVSTLPPQQQLVLLSLPAMLQEHVLQEPPSGGAGGRGLGLAYTCWLRLVFTHGP